jgi:hypothetical protein
LQPFPVIGKLGLEGVVLFLPRRLSLLAFEPSMTWAKGLDFKFSDLGLHLFGLELFRWVELSDLDQ